MHLRQARDALEELGPGHHRPAIVRSSATHLVVHLGTLRDRDARPEDVEAGAEGLPVGDGVGQVDHAVALDLRVGLVEPSDDVGHEVTGRAERDLRRLVDLPPERVQRDASHRRHLGGSAGRVQGDVAHLADDEVLDEVGPVLDAAEVPLVVLEADRPGVHQPRACPCR